MSLHATPLDLTYNFASLSVKDLLEARDTYHFHLLSKANVVGTAIGLYLIRKDEAWPSAKGEAASPPNKKSYPRTLGNSEVRDYSWPCVLVFVRVWEEEQAFSAGGKYEPAKIVPKTLYMADGRAVPVCVVQADEAPPASESGTSVAPAFMLGGGAPICVTAQGADHVATAGCLVSDGHLTYALTARHATGEEGTSIKSRLRGGEVTIGVSARKQLTRRRFSDVYPDFPGRRSYIAMDAGLVKLDDIEQWTSNSYGLPPVGPLADVHDHSLSLRLIDQTVVGWGAVSGLLRGTVKALFYRYRSVGGFDYVADFLIAPSGGVSTRPGDSGMVWHLDVTGDDTAPLDKRDLRPMAMEWGGQLFEVSGARSAFAVATSLSGICRLLDVELVTDQSRGVSGYWGRTGHYSIAAFAISLVGDADLRDFLEANADLLSFDLEAIAQKGFDKSVGQLGDDFVPLADVPDEIWKKLDHGKNGREGGRDLFGTKTGSDGPEHPNHYADLDSEVGPQGPTSHNQTFRAMCLADPAANLTPQAWLDYYEQLAAWFEAKGDEASAQRHRTRLKQGLLPFRLWQFFDAMSDCLDQGDVVGFLAAAGTAAHYMGDASQPLHGSIYSNGDPSRTATREHPQKGTTETVAYGDGVHSAYETAMVSRHAGELIALIRQRLNAPHPGVALCTKGGEIARATLELMDEAAKTLKPLDIVECYERAGAGTRVATLDALWQAFDTKTADVMILGARYLAMLWESAWALKDRAALKPKLKPLDKDKVRARYIDTGFVPSFTLDKIGPHLK